MKVLFLIFFLCLATFTHASVGRGTTPDEKKTGHPNQCWQADIGYIDRGVTKRLPKQCVQITCENDGEYDITGCGAVSAKKPCRVGEGDLSLPYPDCCHKIKCPKK